MLLIVLPWSGFWEQNYFATRWPALGTLLQNDYVRGAVSGLGVVNLIAGLADLVPIFAGRVRHEPMGDIRDVP